MSLLNLPNHIYIPPYEGERCETEIPDTLNLAEMARIALNALTRVWDINRDYEIFFHTDFRCRPPLLIHNDHRDSCLNIPPKLLEALPLVRIVSGSDYNIAVDKKVLESQIRIIGDDGLGYAPSAKDRPWIYPKKKWRGTSSDKPFADVWGEGRMILAMCMWYQRDKKPFWRRIIEGKIDRLLKLVIKKDDYHYFSKSMYYHGEKPSTESLPEYLLPEESGTTAYRMGAICHGAALFYRLSRYKPALELASGLVKWACGRVFDEDGRFLGKHFHHTTYAIIGILEYALASNDKDLIELIKRCYEYGKTIGDPPSGFFSSAIPGSEWYLKQHKINMESCNLADMIVIALKLTKSGVGEYWEDVDKYVRNMFVEGQMTSTDWVERIPEHIINISEVKPNTDKEDAAERSIGSWAGWANLNDWWIPESGPGIMQCCTGNLARALYYVWDSILQHKEDKVQINLLLNRASPWVDIESYLPFQGKVKLKIKKTQKMAVRIPEWTNPEQIKCKVNDKTKEFTWSNNYLEVSELRSGDTVTVEFPIQCKVTYRVIGENPYKITVKGNTIIDLEPKGTIYPLFERNHYKQEKTPKKKFTYFVSKETIIW